MDAGRGTSGGGTATRGPSGGSAVAQGSFDGGAVAQGSSGGGAGLRARMDAVVRGKSAAAAIPSAAVGYSLLLPCWCAWVAGLAADV